MKILRIAEQFLPGSIKSKVNEKGKSSHWINSFKGIVQVAGRLADDKSNSKLKILRDLAEVSRFTRVVELGCGLGGWLIAAKALGVDESHGYDIPEIDVSERQIGAENFTAADLRQPFDSPDRFDLVIATEVADQVRTQTAPGQQITPQHRKRCRRLLRLH